jgi:hypothetical protein
MVVTIRHIMLNDIVWIYRRILPFLWGVPLLAAVPFAAELLQHVVEFVFGLYRSGVLTPAGRDVRLAFGLVKIAGIIVIVVVALRWWHCDGDTRRALRPNLMLAAGFLAFITFVFAGSSLVDVFVAMVDRFIHLNSTPPPVRRAIQFVPTFGWLFLSRFWLPWNVALLIEDREMTLRRSILAARGHLWMYLGLIGAGAAPLMAVHYGLGFAAIGKPDWVVWVLSIADAAIVVVLVIAVASSFYAVYDDARARTNGDSTASA